MVAIETPFFCFVAYCRTREFEGVLEKRLTSSGLTAEKKKYTYIICTNILNKGKHTEKKKKSERFASRASGKKLSHCNNSAA